VFDKIETFVGSFLSTPPAIQLYHTIHTITLVGTLHMHSSLHRSTNTELITCSTASTW